MNHLLCFLLLSSFIRAQILADFATNIPIPGSEDFKTFTVQLDHEQAPMATANFMLLAGLSNEEWLGAVGDITPAPHVPYSPLRPGRVYQRNGRLPLNIVYQEADPGVPSDVDKYVIRQATTVFAIVSTTPFGNVYRSLAGPNPVEIHYDNFNNRFKIVINQGRDWLDSRFFGIRKSPLYRNIPVTKIETGLRFFSGSFENDPFYNPGYTFPDELVSRVINGSTPWRTKFNQGWVLAMDSSGRNANGSRFFITGQATAQNINQLKEWNQRYTSFGNVLTINNSRATVQEILNYSTTDEGLPEGNLIIRNISFRRLGGSEVGFFPHLILSEMPGPITPVQLRIERQGFNKLFLVSPPTPGAQKTFLTSKSLVDRPILFRSYGKPFDFNDTREDISTGLRVNPQAFFRSYFSLLPDWPAQDFDFSEKEITFTRLSSAGSPQGLLKLTFGTTPPGEAEASFGTYTAQIPAFTVDLGGGEMKTFPAFIRMGTFNSELIDDEQPHRATLKFLSSNPELPLDEVMIDFDFDRSRLLEDRFSRFTVRNTEDIHYFFSGFWYKTN
ncbi:MAG: peptidylprolyl isomerase [Akkermansiaceae bacterium]